MERPAIAVEIRASRAADVAAIQAIYAGHVLHGLATFEEVPPDAGEMARRREEVLGRGLPYLVAAAEGRVLGYAYAAPFRARGGLPVHGGGSRSTSIRRRWGAASAGGCWRR